MKDKEILDVVYEVLKASQEADMGVDTDQIVKEQLDFIEQEWQKQDEKELVDQYNRNRNPKDWIVDVREIERHRGLEIGKDGSVTGLMLLGGILCSLTMIAMLGTGCAATQTHNLLYEEENITRKSVTEEDYFPPKETA